MPLKPAPIISASQSGSGVLIARRSAWQRFAQHPCSPPCHWARAAPSRLRKRPWGSCSPPACRSEEHTSELQSLMRISYAVFCLNKKKQYLARIITSHTLISHNKLSVYSSHI